MVIPKKEIKYLGFLLNATAMSVSLPHDCKLSLKAACNIILSCGSSHTIPNIALTIGNLVCVLPAAKYGTMHYRALEESKIQALKQAKGNFDKKMIIPRGACTELQWWSNNAPNLKNSFLIPNRDFVLATDASNSGWEQSLGTVKPMVLGPVMRQTFTLLF